MVRAVVFLQPGMADWEAGPVLGGLHEYFGGTATVATPDGQPVQPMGGLRVAADLAFHEVNPAQASVLLVIGSDSWPDYRDQRFFDLLRGAAASGVPVGAICAGTIAVARTGLLEGRAPTSNSSAFLRRHAATIPAPSSIATRRTPSPTAASLPPRARRR